MTSSYSVATPADAAKLGSEQTVICGKKMGVVTGEVIVTYVKSTTDPACTKAGLKAVGLTEYKDFASTVLAVGSSNVQGMIVDTMTFSQYARKTKSDLTLNGPTRINESDAGYSFLKSSSNAQLAPVVRKAENVLISDGVYAKLLKKYGLTTSGLTDKSVLNPSSKL